MKASKLANGAVTTAKIADNAVTGAKVDEAALGIVPDAAKLAGKEPAAYESKGFGGSGDSGAVTLPAGANTTTVQTLNLSAGSYLVLARGGANNNGAAEQSGPTCTVAAGGTSQGIEIGELGINVKAGDREEFSAYIVATLATAGSATLKCTTDGTWESGNITDPSLAAVSLQP